MSTSSTDLTPSLPSGLPFAVLSVKGTQAREFLQGQVSCDLSLISPTQASLGTLCSLKGRMMASFVLCQYEDQHESEYESPANVAADENPSVKPEQFFLIMHNSLITSTYKDLSKYAIFAQCDLTIQTDLSVYAHRHPEENFTPFSAECLGDTVHINLSSSLQFRLSRLEQTNSPVKSQPISEADFFSISIDALLPWLTDETADKFLPQAFFEPHYPNAVSYTKGCYKGQEIVARMHFKGTMKEGLQKIANHQYTVGQVLRDDAEEQSAEEQSAKKIGTVINSAGNSCAFALAVMRK